MRGLIVGQRCGQRWRRCLQGASCVAWTIATSSPNRLAGGRFGSSIRDSHGCAKLVLCFCFELVNSRLRFYNFTRPKRRWIKMKTRIAVWWQDHRFDTRIWPWMKHKASPSLWGLRAEAMHQVRSRGTMIGNNCCLRPPRPTNEMWGQNNL